MGHRWGIIIYQNQYQNQNQKQNQDQKIYQNQNQETYGEEIIEYAKELYLTPNEEGKHQYSLREISTKIQQKFNYVCEDKGFKKVW